MKILGISAFYHDSAAVIAENGEVLAAAQEERFTRIKHDSSFPSRSVSFCLEQSGFSLQELDAIVFYDKPLLKFERILESFYASAPKGFWVFVKAMPVWIREKIFLKKLIFDNLNEIEKIDRKKIKLLFSEHHLSHAASAFFVSPYEEAAIITIDGVGEWATASICLGQGNKIKVLKELRYPHSVGLLYSAFTYYLGFKINSGEYKMMGLAPYGNPSSENTKKYATLIKEHMIDIKEDGSVWLNHEYFNYIDGLTMTKDDRWKVLLGLERRKNETELTQQHCDLALAIQAITEEIVLKMAKHAKEITKAKHLCMAGGVALNCVANGEILRSGIFEDIFIQPASGDAGGALGAALAAEYCYFGKKRKIRGDDAMNGAYLGPEFSDLDIERVAKRYKAIYAKIDNYSDLASKIADILSEGNVVGWFQGRMEFGPRALGNRSILGDARNEEMQKKLNLKIKHRESFRPFAPSVLNEDREVFFELKKKSPYMLLVADVKKNRCSKLPKKYLSQSLMERLYIARSDIQAVTHVNFSARIQTVHKETNPRYWGLINSFKSKTGYGVVVNTSFNVRGEPIVCTPEDAYRCFMRTEMDYLVMGDYVFDKNNQPDFKEKCDWRKEFVLD